MFENLNIPSELIPSDPRFGSGPSLIPTQFVDRLRETGPNLLGTSHRKPPVKNLVKGIKDGLREYFNVPDNYTIAVGNGGATFLWDMISLGMVRKRAYHFTAGEFGEKWFKASQLVPWIETDRQSVDYGQGVTPKNIPDRDLIACTLNETSTGVQIDSLPDVGSDTLLCVDATSGAGQCPCDVSKTDIFYFSPQKVFASEGGFFVAILSPKALKRANEINEDPSRYIPAIMNWKTCLDNSSKDQTYNSPSISTLFFLNEQMKQLNKIGYEGVIEQSRKKADLVYGWAKEKKYLSPFVKESRYQSYSVATIDVDDKIDVNALAKKLGDDKIVYGIEAYRKLGRNQLRIALFQNILFEDLEKLTKLLSRAIEPEL